MNISNIPKYKFYLSTWLSRRKLWSQSFAASLEHHNYPSYRTAGRATLCVCPLMPCLSTAHPAMSTGSYCIKAAMMRLKNEASENAWVEHYYMTPPRQRRQQSRTQLHIKNVCPISRESLNCNGYYTNYIITRVMF